MLIFPFIGLAKQSKALEAGLQLLSMVGQWWAQSQAAACILSQVLEQLAPYRRSPLCFDRSVMSGTGLPARVLLILATASVSSCYKRRCDCIQQSLILRRFLARSRTVHDGLRVDSKVESDNGFMAHALEGPL